MRLGFLCISIIPLLIKGQVSPSIELTRITPNDITNGGTVCPNLYPVEITCVGIEVPLLQWQRNETNVGGSFSGIFNNIQQVDSFTLILDSIITRDIVANITSRLVANISNLVSGDVIGCATININRPDTVTLNYRLRERPPEVPTNIPVSIESNGATVDISITWDSAFNSAHNVTSYSVVASEGSAAAASCPSFCDPSGPCVCTGFEIGEDTTITITAINCEDQMGMPIEVTARPRVPSAPVECSVLPVYSSARNLSAVDLTWTIVNDPLEFLSGVGQDVTGYSIAVGTMDPMTIPASIACPTSTCNYSIQSLSVLNSPLSASVSSVNVIGMGEVCTPQEIDIRNQIFSLILDTTNIGNQTVACILQPSADECEFCYSAGDSCQNLSCIPATTTPTPLPSLTELTYCYRATASANGIDIAVIQDTFNTACPLAPLGTFTNEPSDRRCSSDSIGSVSIPHGLGCYDGQRRGAVANYQCDKWYALSGGSSRLCMGDGNWDGEVPQCRFNGGNIALLALSIPSWVLSLILSVIGCVALKKEIFSSRSLLNFHFLSLWSKITYIILLTFEFLFLLVVLLLWISAGTIPDGPNSGSQQTSLLIAAFVLALPWIIGALIFLFVMSKCSSHESAKVTDDQKNEENGKSNLKTIETPTPLLPVYAVPDKSKKKRPPETSEHKPDCVEQNIGKRKGFLVKKGKGKKKALENIELPSYDVLEGPGHRTGTGKPAPKAPITEEKYDVLDAKGQEIGDRHLPINQGVYSNIPGEPQHVEAEYSQVDKRSSKERLLSQTSSK